MWAIKHISDSRLDGYREYFEGAADVEKPAAIAGHKTKVFVTRREAREYIEQRYGYRRTRPDLRAEPFGWRMPRAVRVRVDVTEVSN